MTSPHPHGSARTPVRNSGRESQDTASFPNPVDIGERPGSRARAPSIASTRVTDFGDGDGEREGAAMGGASPRRLPQSLIGRVHGLTGPAGEPGLPPSRPSSATTAKSGAGRRTHGSYAGSTGAASFRPATSNSRTHVPSLTSQAFFHPMSSQRLQAQRGQRPMSYMGATPPIAQETPAQADTRATGNRTSNGSGHNIRGSGPGFLGLTHEEQRPTTRGTDVTTHDMPDRGTGNTSPNGAETLRSMGESEHPLSGLEVHPHYPSATTAALNSELGKNHEYFTGNTVFCWGGRLQNTKERPISVFTFVAMLLPALLFFAFSASYLWRYASPAIPILFAYVFLICASSFLHASFTNPGILPRNLHPFPPTDPNEDPLALGPTLTEWTMVISATSTTAAMEVPTKYCKTCNIRRPPRAHHCRTCDNCVETQDHHCVWLNNCVGRRNYRYFFTFIASGTILAVFLFGASLGHIFLYMHHEHKSFQQSIDKLRVPFAMAIYAIIIFLYPFCLTGYHLFLVARGETTREYLQSHKFPKKDRHKPFTQGSTWKNLVVVLLRPRMPTYLQFKRQYVEGDQRLGRRKGKVDQQSAGVEMQKFKGI